MASESQTTAMTPAERERWWLIQEATHEGQDNERFAKELAGRGLITAHDTMYDVTYWRFTPAGKIAMFGDQHDR